MGFHIASTLLKRPKTTVIVGVRDLGSLSGLEVIECGEHSTLIGIKLDSTSETDATEAVSKLKSEHSIQHLDVVLANAGYGTARSTYVSPSGRVHTIPTNMAAPLPSGVVVDGVVVPRRRGAALSE